MIEEQVAMPEKVESPVKKSITPIVKPMTPHEIAQKNMEYQQAKDAEKVKGLFKYFECPGGKMAFSYRKYKNEEIGKYEMEDNKIYTIPLGVAKHINNNIWYQVHGYTIDEHGKPVSNIAQKIKRCAFQSLEYMDLEENVRGGQQILNTSNLAIEG